TLPMYGPIDSVYHNKELYVKANGREQEEYEYKEEVMELSKKKCEIVGQRLKDSVMRIRLLVHFTQVTGYLHHLMKVLRREVELSSHGLFMKSDDDDDEDRDEVSYGEATVTNHVTTVSTSLNEKLDLMANSMREIMLKLDYLATDVNRIKGGEGSSNSRFSRMSKLEFPKFSGEDVKGWMFKVKQFFTIDNVHEEDKLKISVYEEAIVKRFRPLNEDHMDELKNLSMFIAGLPASIELNVIMFRPKSLVDAFSLANLQEATNAVIKRRNTPILQIPKANSGFYANRNYPNVALEITHEEEDYELDISEFQEDELVNKSQELLESECYPEISLNDWCSYLQYNEDPIIESQEMSMSNTHQHSLADVGSEARPLMLERGSYIPWANHFRRYLSRKRENIKWVNKAIDEGPYEFRNFTPSITEAPRMEKEEDLRGDNLKHYEAEIKAMNLILISILNDIYNSVDACITAKAMWQRFKRLMRGTVAKKLEKSHDPLVLVAHTSSSSRTTTPYYVTHPSSVVDYDESNKEDSADFDGNTVFVPNDVPNFEEAESYTTALDPSNMHECHRELVPRLEGKNIIAVKWLWKNKSDAKNIVIRNESRLVAKGYKQEEDTDFEESFASFAHL
nr:Gag-Pol polyprotein [Tanacetum cinerariifolium]